MDWTVTGRWARERFAALSFANVRFLVGRSLLSSAGNAVHAVGIGWLAYEISGSAVVTGASLGIRSLPLLLVGPHIGVRIDRYDRNVALRLSSAYMVAVSVVFALFLRYGTLETWHLFLFMIASGVGWAANAPTRRAVYADAVPKPLVLNALSIDAMVFETSRLIAPALVGLAIAAWGVEAVFWGQSVAYLVSLGFAMLVSVPRHDVAAVRQDSYIRNLGQGLAYSANNRTVRVLVLSAFALAFSGYSLTFLLIPVVAVDGLDLGAEAVGVLFSGAALGGVLAPAVLAAAGDVRRKHIVLAGYLALQGIAIVAFSFAALLWMAFAFLAVVGFTDVAQRTLGQAMLQEATSSEFRGRVTSVYTMVGGLAVLSGLLGGLLADTVGIGPVMLMAGVATIAIGASVGMALGRASVPVELASSER